MQTEMQKTALHDTALIAVASFSRWRPKTVDKEISREVSVSHGTDQNSGDFLKRLFPNYKAGNETLQTFPELQALLQVLDTLYAWHAANTLVWDGKGRRLLPAVSAVEHKAKFDAVIAQLPALLDAIEYGYSAALSRAQSHLNGMFRAADYPSVTALRSKFAVSVVYEPVPQIVTSNLPGSVLGLINSQIETRVKAATEASTRDMWDRMYACVERAYVQLSKPGGKVYDSLIGNIKECCQLLSKLNVTGNAELEAMRANVAERLSKWDCDTLRANETLRANVAAQAGTVLASIRGIRSIEIMED